jgi:hypothetical protein
VDNAGTLYITGAAVAWNVVWKVDLATNTISVVAGTGALGFSGDGGPATAATFNGLSGIAVATTGDLYLSDSGGNPHVRKVAADVVVPFSVIVDLSTTQTFLDLLTSVQGSVVMVNVNGRIALALPNLVSTGVSLTVTGNSSLVDLSAPVLGTVGSVIISGNPLLNAVSLNGLTTVFGNLTVTNNAAAATVSAGSLSTVGGSVTISGNTSASSASVSSSSIGGSVDISGNTAATTVGVTSSSTIGGSVAITNNPASTSTTVSSSTIGETSPSKPKGNRRSTSLGRRWAAASTSLRPAPPR